LDSADFIPWADIPARFPAWGVHVERLEASARLKSTKPSSWWCRAEPLSLRGVRIETRSYANNRWTLLEKPDVSDEDAQGWLAVSIAGKTFASRIVRRSARHRVVWSPRELARGKRRPSPRYPRGIPLARRFHGAGFFGHREHSGLAAETPNSCGGPREKARSFSATGRMWGSQRRCSTRDQVLARALIAREPSNRKPLSCWQYFVSVCKRNWQWLSVLASMSRPMRTALVYRTAENRRSRHSYVGDDLGLDQREARGRRQYRRDGRRCAAAHGKWSNRLWVAEPLRDTVAENGNDGWSRRHSLSSALCRKSPSSIHVARVPPLVKKLHSAEMSHWWRIGLRTFSQVL